MELGISSLGFIVDLGYSGEYESLFDLFIKSSQLCLEFAENKNIKICELVLEPPEFLEIEKKNEFIELCDSFSTITKQIHSPFLDLCLCSCNKFISKATIDSYIESARLCQEINSNILTIHPGYANFLVKSIHQYNNIFLLSSVNEILEAVNRIDIKVCIENMPKMVNIFLNIPEFDEFFEKLNRKDIFMTWDTSHSWTCDVDNHLLWKKFNKKIKNIHLVDNNDKNQDRHPTLGTGDVDFQEVFNLVEQYNYKGALIVELSSAKDLPNSIDFIKKFF